MPTAPAGRRPIYDVIDDPRRTLEFFVLAKCDLALKVRVYNLNSFGIVYVGPAELAPGLDWAYPDLASSAAGRAGR